MEFSKSRVSGARRGSEVARRKEPTVRIMLLISEQDRWSGPKLLYTAVISTRVCLTGSKSFLYQGLGCVWSPGAAKSGALFTRVTVHTRVRTVRAIIFYACGSITKKNSITRSRVIAPLVPAGTIRGNTILVTNSNHLQAITTCITLSLYCHIFKHEAL